ncbi:hypothetical protein [Natronococcus sp. A-GB7]|uniref:hypothetical protein n=1 Tax=Natronococcus sp. A-GB7 TaxID=3037649 RepID=UPI002420480D|nr:hypothetical protein [Natronococcus sp. A-GB7]MDG5818521.1 hypothetical protein [Natronococcus sp. A-GB7]
MARGRSSAAGGGTVIEDLRTEAVLEGSDGSYYTGWEVARRLRSGDWSPCLRQDDPDRRLVETESGELLLLAPIDPAALPARAAVRLEGEAARVVRTRPRCRRLRSRQYGFPDGQ